MTDTASSDATSDATTTDVTKAATTPDPANETAAELAKWKELARKNEQQAKANLKELDSLKAKSMTEQEKAVDAAKSEGRIEALREVGVKLANASIRVAAAGRNVDVDALLEGVDASKFIDANGDPDERLISAWMNRVAPAVDETAKTPTKRDLGQGARGDQALALNGDPLLRDIKAKLGI